MKRLKTLIVACAALLGAVQAWGGFTKTGTITSSTAVGTTLQNGTIYTVSDNITKSAGTGGNALNVAGGATAALYIPSNVTLTVNGGNGSGRTPGGAGIYLPSNSKLIVFGGGKLVANGGNAGNGSSGTKGGNASANKKTRVCTGGTGGTGGAGGGGAGAGIGGSGGWGGAATAGPSGASRTVIPFFSDPVNGSDAPRGNGAGAGVAAGTLTVLGTVQFTASAGTKGSGGGCSGNGTDAGQIIFSMYCAAGSGGGGAGGGSGYAAPYGFGGGAGGGGAGGPGGSGGIYMHKNTYYYLYGGGGFGGAGGSSGNTAPGIGKKVGNYHGGDCGAAGLGGITGGAGALYKASTATVNCGRTAGSTADLDGNLTYTVSFDGDGAVNDFTKSQTVTYTATMSVRPEDVAALPTIAGLTFDGYWTAKNGGGTQYVDANGQWISDFALTGNLTLYAKWSGSLCTVTFDRQSGSGGESTRSVACGSPDLNNLTSLPTRSGGYQFCGYFTATGGSGTQVFTSSGAATKMWTPTTSAATLYAYWIQVQGLSSLPGEHGTLSNGAFYQASTVSYAPTAQSYSALIATGTTYLYIPSGVTLTCKGADAIGTAGGGAGIKLESGNTLVVFGGGTLKATGGKAGNGATGGNGGGGYINSASSTKHEVQGGTGGTGGAGGGGAGAGIGGGGGSGGSSSSGPTGPYWSYVNCASDDHRGTSNGKNGYTGNSGGDGTKCGTLYALGSVTITATGGSAGSGGAAGNCGTKAKSCDNTSWYHCYTAGGGGAGGGGGGGCAGYVIGGGGAGGGSGGSGASGGTTARPNDSGYNAPMGQGGYGGSGGNSGSQGNWKTQDSVTGCGPKKNVTAWGGLGGSGGSAGSVLGKGTVYKSANASVNGGTQYSATTHSGLQRQLTLVGCSATSAGTSSQTADFQNGFNWKGADITIPTRTGCDFGGYYTDQFGKGTQHIGADGVWVTGYGTFAARKLFAKWTANITVDKQGDGTVTGAGTYLVGTETTNTTTIAAAPAKGWKFARWSDGSTEISRTVEVTGHAAYTAIFTADREDEEKWKGYDPETGDTFETDEAAVAAGYAVRAGREYHTDLAGAFTNAASGVTIELLTNLVDQVEVPWGEAAIHPFDGHGYAVDFICNGDAISVAAGHALVVSNVTFNGRITVAAGAEFGIDGATKIDLLNLGEGVKIDVFGDLTGTEVNYTAEGGVVTTNYAGQAEAEAYFHYQGTAGAYVNDDGEIQIDWYYGTGTAADPYRAIDTILDESVTRLLNAAGKAEPKRFYLAVPTSGLVSTTAGASFAIPTGKALTIVLPDDLPAGDNALLGPLASGTNLDDIGLKGLVDGKIYHLTTNDDNVLVLNVTEFTGEVDNTDGEQVSISGLTGETNLIKKGDGTLDLQGENTYTGKTFVNGGKLVVEGLISESTIEVNEKAGIEVRGNGTLVKPLSIAANGYFEVSEDVALTNKVTLQDGAIIKYTGTFAVDEEQLEAFRADGTSVSCLSADENAANFTYEGGITLVFDSVFTNGTYTILAPLPAAVDVSKFAIDTAKSDATKNYALEKDANGNLIVTVTTKDIALSADLVDEQGAPATEPLTIAPDWIKKNLPSYRKPNSTETKVGVELNAEAPNGMTYWQNYVLNIDPTNTEAQAFVIAAPQTTSVAANVLKLEAKGIDARTDAGVALGYRIDQVTADGETSVKGKVQVSSAFELPLDSIGPTGVIYRVNAVFADSKTKTKTSPYEISGGATYGIIRVTATNRLQAIAAPFLELTGTQEDAGISVSNLVRTSTLTPGDKLHIYNDDGSYKVYTLAGDGVTWETVPVLKVSALLTSSLDEGTPSDEQVARRGIGAWLERKDPSKPFTLFGKFSLAGANVELKKASGGKIAHNLLGDTGVEPFNLSRVKGAAEDSDQILVPGVEPKLYTFKDGKWGYYKQVVTKRIIGGVEKTGVKSVWTTDESTIPAGTGYWLVNRSGNEITVE